MVTHLNGFSAAYFKHQKHYKSVLTVAQKTVPIFGHFAMIDAYLNNNMVKYSEIFRAYSIQKGL
jgi:hypothetical protein